MADSSASRYRSNETYPRDEAPAASDPLAELARLIGQSDPYASGNQSFGLRSPPGGSPRFGFAAPHQNGDTAPTQDDPSAPQYQHDDREQPYAYDRSQPYADTPSQDLWQSGGPAEPAHSSDPYAGQNDYTAESHRYASSDQYSSPAEPHSSQYGRSPAYENQGYADAHGLSAMSGGYQHDQGHGSYGAATEQDRQSYAPVYPHEPGQGAMPPPHNDEYYDDDEPDDDDRRRKNLITVAAVFGLALLGSAGAFAYRGLVGGPTVASAQPPVIHASNEPSKVAPPPAPQDQSTNKIAYDRFADAGQNEQVVRREEKPVPVTRATAPPTIAPPVAPPPVASAKPATTASANPPSAIGEPRRVRTVPIKPDQAEMAMNAPGQPQTPAQVNAARQATAALPAERPARNAPAPSANAPLSLSPDANNAPAPAPAPRAAAAPTRVASAPASGNGSYLVQVASQKSEADAHTALRNVQTKYASVVGSQPSTVRRADLGAKGVYYRAMVGPFASREEAVQVCLGLKQAGGDCVVQH